jgi:hypothetical protein
MESNTLGYDAWRVGYFAQPDSLSRAHPRAPEPAGDALTMTVLWIVAIVVVAAVLQSLTGFGFALIVMPLVTLVIDLQTAAPLVALAGLTA